MPNQTTMTQTKADKIMELITKRIEYDLDEEAIVIDSRLRNEINDLLTTISQTSREEERQIKCK